MPFTAAVPLNLNPFDVLAWSWRALRGHSLTFAGLFACGVLGLSVISQLRRLLDGLGAPWYAWLLVPLIAIGYLAKKETEWMPEPETRKKWARRVFFGSIALAFVLAKLGADRREETAIPPPAAAGPPPRK